MDDLDAVRDGALAAVAASRSSEELEAARVAALGKKGTIAQQMALLGRMDPDARKAFGARVNAVRDGVLAALDARRAEIDQAELAERLERERIDVTLPALLPQAGRIHPISQTIEEAIQIFGAMGFSVAEGPDIEDDFHNFTALNFPIGHPAREMHDTFYLRDAVDAAGNRLVLRTHTSPVQVRSMETMAPPIRVICPGRTFRSDSDQTHSPMFHQIEGLVIDRAIDMGHLKGCLTEFAAAFFEIADPPMRFRPSFFPFTEPSAEVDIGCSRKGGELVIGAGSDWLEILGCGMVHPNVLKACGLDPQIWQGFAFGMGVERITMLKHGIPDLRPMFEGDPRWLQHYGFSAFDVPSLVAGLNGVAGGVGR